MLDEYVQNEARPISLRQLTFFGRSLNEARLLGSANYVRTELPTRLAHRIRDMQTLPYVVVTNPHMSEVYELYYKAFETLRRVREIKTLDDNEEFCQKLNYCLQEHLTVIPKLAMGVLETRDLMNQHAMDKFMNTILRARISRRVIAEQHLSLTKTFSCLRSSSKSRPPQQTDFVGEVFLKCNAMEVVKQCGAKINTLAHEAYGPSTPLPEIKVEGHLEATFPYMLSHLEYIVAELLRNSIQATVEHQKLIDGKPLPIEVTICEAPQHVIIRISDRGGGIPQDVLPYLWSFSKGPRSQTRLDNLYQVPKMAATMQEIHVPNNNSSQGKFQQQEPPVFTKPKKEAENEQKRDGQQNESSKEKDSGLLSPPIISLTSRPPNLRLGMGLPMSRVFAEYWAGRLEVHSLEGYGVDAFLQISKLGNKNEQLTTRASMDGV